MEFSNWHYQRALIAESYFRTIFSGVMLSTTVFAESKTGLTHFFIHDLMPCAMANDYGVVYVDLSNDKVPVTAAFLMALDRVLMPGHAANVSFNFFKGIFVAEKNNLNAEYYMNKFNDLDHEFFKLHLDYHLDLMGVRIINILKKKRLILIFDHAHNLARDVVGEGFCRFLRNLLVQQRDGLKPIYGTSNINQWSSIFKNARSPLNSEGASIHNLPVLDRVFVREVMQKAGIRIELDDAVQCYKLLGYKPGLLIAMVSGWNAQDKCSFFDYFAGFIAEIESTGKKVDHQQKKGSYEIYH